MRPGFEPWLIVTGDFTKTGGMDIANFMLARVLARRGHHVHLVAHRVADELRDEPGVIVHIVPKILGSYFLSAPLLNRMGRKWAAYVTNAGGRVLVNGGNCDWHDINWIHYLHAKYDPVAGQPAPRGIRARIRRRISKLKYHLYRRDEERIIAKASVVIANSVRTKLDVDEVLSCPHPNTKTVYYGTDGMNLQPASSTERMAMRAALRWPKERDVVCFIGALTDDRKGFDIVFDAWKDLCRDETWDCTLAVIGAGDQTPLWKARAAADPRTRHRTQFLGFQPRAKEILRATDLLVLPTRYEAYGLVVHEAICCNIPAIVTSMSGVAERYSAEMAYLIMPDACKDHLVAAVRRWRMRRDVTAVSKLGSILRQETWEAQMGKLIQSVQQGGMQRW